MSHIATGSSNVASEYSQSSGILQGRYQNVQVTADSFLFTAEGCQEPLINYRQTEFCKASNEREGM
jgi:hypothetical protein